MVLLRVEQVLKFTGGVLISQVKNIIESYATHLYANSSVCFSHI